MFTPVTPVRPLGAFVDVTIEPYYVNTVLAGADYCGDHTNGFAAWARANKVDNGAGLYGYGVAGHTDWVGSEAARDAWLDVLDTYTPSSWKDVATLTIQ